MKSIIEKYKTLIFVFVAVNLFALLVNVFDISISLGNGSHLFTDTKTRDNGLWPFVPYVEDVDFYHTYGTHAHDYTEFHGIFYGYDISEFLLYIGLLVAFLIYKAYIVKPKPAPVTRN